MTTINKLIMKKIEIEKVCCMSLLIPNLKGQREKSFCSDESFTYNSFRHDSS